MKVLILAGGLGTRMSEYTHSTPKPMVMLGDKPLIWHIMQQYSYYGYNDFLVALGYKGEEFKKYFLNYHIINSDFTIETNTGVINKLNKNKENWKITFVDTGINTLTGGRIRKLKKYLNEPFFCTYGDGLSNININKLLKFHKTHKKIATLTAVRPPAKFGELNFNIKNKVTKFQEKPHLNQGWINGGFFVFEKGIFDFLKGKDKMLEREPFNKLIKHNELIAFPHKGFWKACDSKRDLDYLKNKIENNNCEWIL